MNFIKIAFVVLALSWVNIGYSQSIDSLYKIAADSNREVRAAYEEFNASMQRATRLGGMPDPVFSFGYFINPIETRVGPQRSKIGLSQMFPWFGTLASQENSAASMAQAKYHIFLDKQDFLYVKLAESYYPMLEIEEQIRLENENLKILKSFKSLAKTSFSNGKSSMVDILRIDIEIENSQTNLLLLNELLKPLRIQLNNLLNWPPDSNYSLNQPFKISMAKLNVVTDTSFSKHPSVVSLLNKLESAEYQEVAAKKQGAPKIGVGVDYFFIDKSNSINSPDNGRDALMPMVSISIPLYRRKYKAAIAEAQHYQKAVSYEIENRKNVLSSKYGLAEYDVTSAIEKHELYDRQISTLQQAIRITLQEYATSGKDYEELLRLQQKLLKYKMLRATQIREYFIAKTKLNYIISK